MTSRANWKGTLKVAELICPVALYSATSTSDRIAFHTINRKTGHRVHREFVDSETGNPVEAADQVKGYETDTGEYVALTPEEIEAAIPDADKILDIQAFIKCAEIDDLYFDRQYYLTPSTPAAGEAFALLHQGMKAQNVAALCRTVLFRRMRSVLVRAHDEGFIATTLNLDYEIRSAKEAFGEIPVVKIEGEMLDLARHIIGTKTGTFDPTTFTDRYEDALADLVRAKLEGRRIRRPEQPKSAKVVDLMDALRQSAKIQAPDAKRAKKRASSAKATRKAG